MTTALVEIKPMPHSLINTSLDDLAGLVRQESELVEAHLNQALMHALQCGEILLAAHKRFERGIGFRKWVEENTSVTYARALVYERLAFYSKELDDPTMGVNAALWAINGLPKISSPEADRIRESSGLRSMVRTRLDDGEIVEEIAKEFGITVDTILMWHDPKLYERRKLERARVGAIKAQAREQRAQDLARARMIAETKELVKNPASPDAAKAYSLVRQLLPILDRLNADARDARAQADPKSYSIRPFRNTSIASCYDEARQATRACEVALLEALRNLRETEADHP